MDRHGGFLVAPSGTCFARLREDEVYRRAVVAADLAIADSGLMVLLWRLLRREKIGRISGLKYLKHLLGELRREGTAEVFWVLPSEPARQKLFQWSRREAFPIASKNCYVAPRYGMEIEDRNLLSLLEQDRLTGEQIPIPDWVDRFYLGWLLRLITQPHRFVPRLIRGFELPWLIWKYGENLPPLEWRSDVRGQ